MKVEKTKFCCFVISNDVDGDLSNRRIELFQNINKWKTVDSAGGVLNNTGYKAPRGIDFLRWMSQYRYMICIDVLSQLEELEKDNSLYNLKRNSELCELRISLTSFEEEFATLIIDKIGNESTKEK